MKLIRRSCAIHNLNVVFGALLQKTFNAATGMFGTLALITVRQQEYQPCHSPPLVFRTGDELIDNNLGSVKKIPELGFPDDQISRRRKRIAKFKTKDCIFRKQGIVNT